MLMDLPETRRRNNFTYALEGKKPTKTEELKH